MTGAKGKRTGADTTTFDGLRRDIADGRLALPQDRGLHHEGESDEGVLHQVRVDLAAREEIGRTVGSGPTTNAGGSIEPARVEEGP